MSIRGGDWASSCSPGRRQPVDAALDLFHQPALCRCTSAQPTRFATLPLGSNSCNASGVSPAAAATRWRTSATDVSTPPDSAVRVGSMSD